MNQHPKQTLKDIRKYLNKRTIYNLNNNKFKINQIR